VSELGAIAVEMLRIPAGLYMRTAEVAGGLTLRAWLFVLPLLEAAGHLAGHVLAVAQREVTPVRAALAAAAGTGILLVASQFADYTSVSIGAEQYSGIDSVAPAPEVEGSAARAGSAHAWIGVPLGLAAVAIAIACATGRSRFAWWLAPIGLVTIVVSLAVDVPKGLDEGDTEIAYEGAEAMLLGGFWVQLACGVMLVALAPLLTSLLRPNGDTGARAPSRLRLGRLRAGEVRG
jgi:hypothetical protein